jgi:hypothetical protein
MKKLFSVVTALLAINFLAIAGGVGYLVQSKKLTKDSIAKIKDIVMAHPESAAPTTQPAEAKGDPTTRPALRLEELLARKSGQTATEQVQFIQQAFDSQMAVLDRRQRELMDQKALVDKASAQLAKDREVLERERAELSDKQKEATRLAEDKGFQDSLALYNSLPGKQVKTIFMTLDDVTIQQYLQAMEPRGATRIVKEFKSPEELARIQKVLERMRNQATPTEGAPNTAANVPTASANVPAAAGR